MRSLSLFLVALTLATSAFWLTMLTSPPKTEAAPQVVHVVRPAAHAPIADDYDPDF